MRGGRAKGSWWDLPPWPPRTAFLASAVAPVVVGTGVTAHFRLVPAGQALGALGVAVGLAVALHGLGSSPRVGLPTGRRVPGWPARGQVPAVAAAGLAVATGLGIWLAATTAWWLLAVGATAVAAALVLGRPSLPQRPARGELLAALAMAELLAGWGTVWVELGRLPVLGMVAAFLPASLATALLILVKLRDLATSPVAERLSPVAGLSERAARTLFHGLLVLALVVPLLITVPGLDGAECFLPWLLAPLGEGPLRNSSSADPSRQGHAVRQTALLLVASSALLAVGVWAG